MPHIGVCSPRHQAPRFSFPSAFFSVKPLLLNRFASSLDFCRGGRERTLGQGQFQRTLGSDHTFNTILPAFVGLPKLCYYIVCTKLAQSSSLQEIASRG